MIGSETVDMLALESSVDPPTINAQQHPSLFCTTWCWHIGQCIEESGAISRISGAIDSIAPERRPTEMLAAAFSSLLGCEF